MKQTYLTGVAGLGLVALLTGCGSTNALQNTPSAVRDFTVSQSNYATELVNKAACQNATIKDYKGFSGKVEKFVDSLIDSGKDMCDITNGVSPKEFNNGLVSVIELAKANHNYKCGVSVLENTPMTMPNTSVKTQFKAANKLVSQNATYMPAIANEVRNCLIGKDAQATYATATSSDLTSFGIWLSAISYSAGKSNSSGGASTPTVGGGAATSNTGNATSSIISKTNSSTTLPVGGSVLRGF